MTAKDNIKRAAVLGLPVNHSLSPKLHGYWIKQYGIEASYEAIAVEPKDLKAKFRELVAKGYVGFNLTVPHKEKALELMDEIDPTARRIGAINTVVIRGGKLIGVNTDVYGFMRNLKAHDVNIVGRKILVMGAGGAARAVCTGLLGAGNQLVVINRTREKALALAKDLGGPISVADWQESRMVMKEIALLVNTTTLGMTGQPPLNIGLSTLAKDAVVTDIIYNPLVTPLLAQAQPRGHRIVDGLGMLLYQAQPAFEVWFGIKPEVTPELRAHVLAGLA